MALAQQVATALLAGQLVVLPTETVYGLCAAASSQEGVRQLAAARVALRGGGSLTAVGQPGVAPALIALTEPAVWLADSAQQVLGLLGEAATLHRRLVARLSPGPVTFLVEVAEAAAAALRIRLNTQSGVLDAHLQPGGDKGRTILVRVPAYALARDVAGLLQARGSAMVADAIPTRPKAFAGSWASTVFKPAKEADDAAAALAESHVHAAMIVDRGPSRLGTVSTRVQLSADGGYRIVSEGAMPSQQIHRAAEKRVLMVCTGNTCRSPMAAALARDAAAKLKLTGIRFESAGLAASEGEPAAPEGIVALERAGISPEPHRARQLTADLVHDADVVYVMTRDHASGVARLSPEGAGKIIILRTDGGDVADPIGQSQAAYHACCAQLGSHISARLQELIA